MKQYAYTILRHNGDIKRYPPCKKKTFKDFYRMLNCTTIEIIPRDYYKNKGYGHCEMYGDEEARFNEDNKRNPYFDTIVAEDGLVWDVVGDIIKEEVFK